MVLEAARRLDGALPFWLGLQELLLCRAPVLTSHPPGGWRSPQSRHIPEQLGCRGLALHAEPQGHPEERDGSSPAGTEPGHLEAAFPHPTRAGHRVVTLTMITATTMAAIPIRYSFPENSSSIFLWQFENWSREAHRSESLLSPRPPLTPRKAGLLPPSPAGLPGSRL